MSVGLLLDMAQAAYPDRIALGERSDRIAFARVARLALGGGAFLKAQDAGCVVFVGVNGIAWPILLFAAAVAEMVITPLNYRLSVEALRSLLERLDRPIVVADSRYVAELRGLECNVVDTATWLERAETYAPKSPQGLVAQTSNASAVLLFTSGTTAAPKGVILRHSNLFSYVIGTVEFGSANESDAALVSVPPYHIAGVGSVLTNTYAARRLVFLPQFTASEWLEMVNRERITQAMLVPTMLARIVDELKGQIADTPTLRTIAYGGAAIPMRVLERALAAFPDVGFVNSYGLTETSSTISVLTPEDHRLAVNSSDPRIARRLQSVGRLVPGVEASIRDGGGRDVRSDCLGELHVRGDQVAGEYLDGSTLDADGWFPTGDRASIDTDGYLYVAGRLDDTIIRGGENIAPAEIEAVLRSHPGVKDVGVVGVPDDEWGQRAVAVVVVEPEFPITRAALREWVRDRVRGSRTPDDIVFHDALPYNQLGKLVRRELLSFVTAAASEGNGR